MHRLSRTLTSQHLHALRLPFIYLGSQALIKGISGISIIAVKYAVNNGRVPNPVVAIALIGGSYAFAFVAIAGLGTGAVIWQWTSDDPAASEFFALSPFV